MSIFFLSMIGERSIEIHRQHQELSHIGEVSTISILLFLEKIFRNYRYQIHIF